jgi:hypothetical protein
MLLGLTALGPQEEWEEPKGTTGARRRRDVLRLTRAADA